MGIFFVCLPTSMVGSFISEDTLWLLPVAVASLLLGALLMFDIGNAAQGYAEMMRSYRPWGVDYSASPMARPGFMRLFGLMFFLVGLGFAFAAVFGEA